MSETSRVLILLGMHRSGTSLTANWLHHCGLQLGDRLLTGDGSNPTGHYEDRDFLRFHKDILEDNDTDYTYHGTPALELSPYHRARAEALVRFKSGLYPQWGWKEPRTCLFAELYRELLPTAKYLILVRPADKVIDSLMQRDWTGIRHALRDHPVKRWYKSYLLRKHRDERAGNYAQAYCYYNKRLIDFARALPPEDYHVVTTNDVKNHSAAILDRLRAWHFELSSYPIDSILFHKPPRESVAWQIPAALTRRAEAAYEDLLALRT